MKLDIRLKEIREQQNISINKCVRDTGIPKRTLKRYENGEITYALEYIITLADYYNISMDELLGRKVRENQNKHKTPKVHTYMER